MAKCAVCEKTMQTGHKLSVNRSRVSRRANRVWKPNVKKIHVKEEGQNGYSMYICVACLRDRKHGKTPKTARA